MSRNNLDRQSIFSIALGITSGLVGFAYIYRRLTARGFAPALDGESPRAVVTGASSGIGEAFARELARRGYDLLLVARRVERLNVLAATLREQYGVDVQVSPADLSKAAQVEFTATAIQALPRVDLLINNAGFGAPGPFLESDLERNLDMIRLHDEASVALMRAALPGMVARRNGAVINVSSTASFFPLPWNASYSASKAFLNTFSQSVQSELAGKGIIIQALCPGFTRSEFHDRQEGVSSSLPAVVFMTAEAVARKSLDALGRGPVVYVPGLGNQLVTLVGRSMLLRMIAAAVVRLFLAGRRTN